MHILVKKNLEVTQQPGLQKATAAQNKYTLQRIFKTEKKRITVA